jgi:hypothetical protein
MLIHAPSFDADEDASADEMILMAGSQDRCMSYALSTIQLIYDTFSSADWLQSW